MSSPHVHTAEKSGTRTLRTNSCHFVSSVRKRASGDVGVVSSVHSRSVVSSGGRHGRRVVIGFSNNVDSLVRRGRDLVVRGVVSSRKGNENMTSRK